MSATDSRFGLVRGAVTLLLLCGCSGWSWCAPSSEPYDFGPPPPDPCLPSDAAARDATGPRMRLYVINVLQLPMPSSDGSEIDGLDLDGTSEVVCGQADYDATRRVCAPPATHGVDNALSGLLGPLTNDSIQSRIDSGSDLILLRVDGIDSLVDDPDVVVTAYAARARLGATLTHAGACATESPTDPGCRLEGGQVFDIDAGSPEARFSSASIVRGRLEASGADVPVVATFWGTPFPLIIRGARISAAIRDTVLVGGVLGGAVQNRQFLNAIASVPAICSYTATVEPILAMYSDLVPTTHGACTLADGGPGGTHCPSGSTCDVATHTCVSCAEASIAFDFEGVAAIEGAIVTPPPIDGGTFDAASCALDGGRG